MGEGDHGDADFGLPGGPREISADRGSDPTTGSWRAPRSGDSAGSNQHSLVSDGGESRDQPLSKRSQESIETEINDLEQNLERYETQDQAVIDRYEGLLAERQRRRQTTDAHQEDERRQRFRRVKNRLLRTFGLR